MSKAFNIKKQYLIFLAIGGVAVSALYYKGSYPINRVTTLSNSSAPYSDSISAGREDGQSSVPEADIVLTGFTLVETEGIVPAYKLEADEARIYQSRQTAYLNNVKADLYNEQGKSLNVAGQTGEVNLKTSDMTLRGRVKGDSAEGFKFSTEHIQWSKRNGKIVGPAPVDIYYKNTRISARQMEADTKSSTLILSGGVETLIRG